MIRWFVLTILRSMASIAPGAWRGGRAWLQLEFVSTAYDAQVGLVYAT